LQVAIEASGERERGLKLEVDALEEEAVLLAEKITESETIEDGERRLRLEAEEAWRKTQSELDESKVCLQKVNSEAALSAEASIEEAQVAMTARLRETLSMQEGEWRVKLS